jgi:hypothetical protein
MTLPELLACVWQRDIRLATRDSKLISDAQTGALTDEIKAALAEHKPDLLALISPGGTPLTQAPAAAMPWPPRPAELADWPIDWRERWGGLANHMEDQGTFRLTKVEMEAARGKPSTAQTPIGGSGAAPPAKSEIPSHETLLPSFSL